MKHISEIMSARREQLNSQRDKVARSHQLHLFVHTKEKGSNEWAAFNAIRHDRSGGYHVAAPKKAIISREPYVIRIYPARPRVAH